MHYKEKVTLSGKTGKKKKYAGEVPWGKVSKGDAHWEGKEKKRNVKVVNTHRR